MLRKEVRLMCGRPIGCWHKGNTIIQHDKYAEIIPSNANRFLGKNILVDIEDVPVARQYTWYIHRAGRDLFYAYARKPSPAKHSQYTKLHRLLLPGAEVVDHINFNGLDNRRCNLRSCLRKQNNIRCRRTNISGYRGVEKYRDRFRAVIRIDGKRYSLGGYATAKEAASAYNKAALEKHGEFAILNEI
jgi:hypothetical protein